MTNQHHTQLRPGPACASVVPLLALVVGQKDLNPQDAQILQAHLETCAYCRSELEGYWRLDGALARHFALSESDPLSPAEIKAILDQTSQLAAKSPARSLKPITSSAPRPLPAKASAPRRRGPRWLSSLSALAAAALLIILVGGLTAGLILVRAHNTTAARTPQPTATLAPSPTQTPTSPPVTENGRASIQMFDVNTGWATTLQCHILRTTDGANHWQDMTPPAAAQGGLPYFLSASVAWIVVQQNPTAVVFKTTDGGQTWQQEGMLTPRFYVAQLLFINAQDGWALDREGATGNEINDLYRTIDGGASWTEVASTGNPPTQPGTIPFKGTAKSISFLDASTGWMAAFSNATNFLWLYVTHDGGVTWQQQTLPMPPGGAQVQFEVIAPTFFNAHDGILPVDGSNSGTVYVTHDGGATWQSTPWIAAGGFDFINAKEGWATNGSATAGSTLYRTSDGGQHWTELPASANFFDIDVLDFVSAQIGWAISFPQTSNTTTWLKTTNGGQTWTALTQAGA